jgi:hypothetical protein
MPTLSEAEAAVAGLHTTEMKGKKITVKKAQVPLQPFTENVAHTSSPLNEVIP